MTISPFARWLISAYDWQTAMMLIGIMAWILLVPAALFVRRPPAAASGPAADTAAEGPNVPLGQIFRSPQFLVLGGDLLCLLCGAFRTNLPHGKLCDDLWRGTDGGCQHL